MRELIIVALIGYILINVFNTTEEEEIAQVNLTEFEVTATKLKGEAAYVDIYVGYSTYWSEIKAAFEKDSITSGYFIDEQGDTIVTQIR